MKKYSIYKFTNTVNGKTYIGKTVQNPTTRKKQHIGQANKGSIFLLHAAIRKYGIDSFIFEIIFNAFSEEYLPSIEIELIRDHNSCILDKFSNGYNMTRGGEGFSSETAKLYAGWNKPNYINPWSGEKGSIHSTKHNKERVKLGTNPWAGEKGSINSKKICAEQISKGTHPFQSSDKARARELKKIENGTHFNQIIQVCPHCGKSGAGRTMFRWHFKNCKTLKD